MTDAQTSTPPAAAADRTPPTPGAGTLAVLALAWLLAMLSSARLAVGSSPDADPLTVTRAALELPQVISASLIAGIAVGLAAVNVLAWFIPSLPARAVLRYGAGAGGGLLTGLAVAAPILFGYDGLPSYLVLSGAIASAAGLGGLLAGVRGRVVVAAGTAGALGVFVVGLVERAFEGNLRHLFGAGESPESVVAATGWAVLTASLAAGAVAGVLGYVYLRRCAPPSLRWPAYLVAGAMPGLLVLAAEVVTRVAGARLFQLVSAASADDQAVLSYFNAARFNRALIVVFVGGLVAIFLLGRTLRPITDPAPAADAQEPPPEPDQPEQPPEAAQAEEDPDADPDLEPVAGAPPPRVSVESESDPEAAEDEQPGRSAPQASSSKS